MPKTCPMVAAALLLSASAGAAEIRLENPGFEADANARGRIPGWVFTQHRGTRAYTFEIDGRHATDGQRSIRLERTVEEDYGMIAQRVPGHAYIGQVVESTASIRTQGVGKEGWVLVMSFLEDGAVLWQERTAPLSGNSDWRRVKLQGKVPQRTTDIEVGFLLLDGGTGWADGVTLASLDKPGGSARPARKSDGEPARRTRQPVPDSSRSD